MFFFGLKKVRELLDMNLKVNDLIISNKLDIVEIMVDYFLIIVDNIGFISDILDFVVKLLKYLSYCKLMYI